MSANNVLAGIVMPKISTERESQSYARFVITPLERGYGVTLGNALRRVLLSSLPGAAVTMVRISGVPHEFTTIPGVREDVLTIMMNLKKLRVKLLDGDRAHLYLEVRGEGEITAADIQPTPEVEIVNPELYLFTIDDPQAAVTMELVVERGRGFSPAEERRRSLSINELAVDAIFSPVRKVNFTVEPERVGQRTNYDRLILEIWTDGTMRPEEALHAAAQILVAHFLPLTGQEEGESFLTSTQRPSEEEPEHSRLNVPIEDLELSVRVYNALKRAGIDTVGDVLRIWREKGKDALLGIRNFGAKSLDELKQKLQAKGYLPEDLAAEADQQAE
ncbi:MAG: DNA-directed RNA polymerase subunit alpha [Chloroflexi bacterium]|nr:DNA-directed RNA polymerase subunit alpha [Chloroflexota bacterium]